MDRDTTMCKIGSSWEAAVEPQELSSELCDDLEAWDGVGGWEVQEGGDIRKHTADSLCLMAETNMTL